MIIWWLIAFALTLTWARYTQSQRVYRVIWYLVLGAVFVIGLVL